MSELPNGWAQTAFGQLFDFKGGSQPPKATFSDHLRPSYVRLLQIRDFESDAKAVFIKDHTRWPKCSADDIMIGRYGASVGKILTGKAGAYNVALVRLIFQRKLLDASWVRLFLLSDHFQEPLKRISRSAQNGFNKADLEEIEIPLAPLPEQRRIVTKIDSLSAKSGRARSRLDHIPRLVRKYKQAILAAAFRGDFTINWRAKNGQPSLTGPRDYADIELSDEERGQWSVTVLPEGWEWRGFGEVFEDITDNNRKLPQKNYLIEGAYPVIDQGESLIGGYTDNLELVHPRGANRSPMVLDNHSAGAAKSV